MVVHGTTGTSIPVPGDIYGYSYTQGCVPLERYAQRVSYPECQFYGVRNEATLQSSACREMWSLAQREMIAYYLVEAQKLIEDELGYFVCPTWVMGVQSEVAEYNDKQRYVDQQTYNHCDLTRWGYLIQAGKRTQTVILEDAVVSHAADPAVIGPIATAVTDENEVFVFYPDSNLRIMPSQIDISGGNMTIYIPRCRMVKASLLDTPSSGLDYTDLTNFQASVDIYRIYTDTTQQATLVTPHVCGTNCLSSACSEYTRTGCMYIHDHEIGHVSVKPATYSGGSWNYSNTGCSPSSLIRLYYLSGQNGLTRLMEDAIIRLAHSLMPEEPCGCDVVQRLWARDRNVPSQITVERASNPFGVTEGAWFAWTLTKAKALVRISGIGTVGL